ncbi:DNA-directed RNA polymerase sigma-70 factor [Longimycelium tulufanense]|uniref:DNA-directed RNA polymerase sigma-70 factor n=1 Tax=Longimycelium tulufanense TaxID=907463 RepID=A0A8J3CG65_9PSEU|nr:sigma-70 family RNA polymerase sigma factor [Longimycelium tulufanense]GGM70881.1 DNA-directed RNA polymerase sigma-70 factor [Longimycelium tulufanense]
MEWDENRFTTLYQENYRTVHAYARHRLPADEVSDIVAETFLIAWRRRADVPDPPLPWLLATARNLVLAHWRRTNDRNAIAVELEGCRVLPQEPAASEVVVERITVLSALSQLEERDRETLLLICWDGLSPQQAAVVLGCSTHAFTMRLHRARRRVTALLDRLDATVTKGRTTREPTQP